MCLRSWFECCFAAAVLFNGHGFPPQGWRDLWVDDAFWRLLFSTILLVIMVLLRPSANSQRSESGWKEAFIYCFNLKSKFQFWFLRFSHSPLIDDDEEEEAKEPMLNEAFGKSTDIWLPLRKNSFWKRIPGMYSRMIITAITFIYNHVTVIVCSSEGMKMRGSKPDSNGSQKLLSKEVGSTFGCIFSLWICWFFKCWAVVSNFVFCFQDEDLKWVEENIPTTVADV